MEIIYNDIITTIFNHFDFNYILSINIITYCIIKTIDKLNGNKKVKCLYKRISLLFSILILTIIYKILGYEDNVIMLNSAIFSPIFYSWFLKPILKKLKISYK